MFFQVDKNFPANNKKLKFTIIWLDRFLTAGVGVSSWGFSYKNSAGVKTITFKGNGTNQWKIDEFVISDAIFDQTGENGSDFMLVNTDDSDDVFNSIEMGIMSDVVATKDNVKLFDFLKIQEEEYDQLLKIEP